jgi:hypothetical protein
MLFDSWPALFSFFDYCCDRGLDAEMCAFIPNAEHWRVVVVGDAAVAAYRNPLQAR